MHVVHTCNRQPGLCRTQCTLPNCFEKHSDTALLITGLDCNTKLLLLTLIKGWEVEGGGLASSNGSACSSPGSALPFLMAQQMLRSLLLIAPPSMCEALMGAS